LESRDFIRSAETRGGNYILHELFLSPVFEKNLSQFFASISVCNWLVVFDQSCTTNITHCSICV